MLDFKLTQDGDLALTDKVDISVTESICQAVRVRLLWFLGEWRLGPDLGFPYFEEVFVKNPNETKIRHYVRETVMEVDGVTNVTDITFSVDKKTRAATIAVSFCTDVETFREEVEIEWPNSTD